MPTKPQRPCKYPGCPNLTDDKSGYCPAHLKVYRDIQDHHRGTSSERGYDGNWQKVRQMFLSQQPLCEECAKRNIIRSADLVHHKDRNPHNNTFDNLEAVCQACHHELHKHDVFKPKENTMLPLGSFEMRENH